MIARKHKNYSEYSRKPPEGAQLSIRCYMIRELERKGNRASQELLPLSYCKQPKIILDISEPARNCIFHFSCCWAMCSLLGPVGMQGVID